ncbi:hypothetical protein ACTWQC_29140 [Streptomyces sp. 8N616]
MSGSATLHCPHGGRAFAASAPTAVSLDGLPVHTASDVFAVTGCTHTVDGVPRPCTTIRWSPHSDSMTVDGAPVLLDTTHAQCFGAGGLVPQGPPVVSVTQQGVVCR